jgi:2,4-dienoyl-CoA reductase-like NADH-dependent reductase (Old Yellow Enzyme family)
MTFGESAETVVAFGRAAGRAEQAGFKVFEIHGAHGYLVHTFLSTIPKPSLIGEMGQSGGAAG